MIASPLHVILRQVKGVHFRVPLVIIVCGGTDHHSRSSSWREPVVHPHSVHRQAATTSMLACYLAIATSWHMIDTNVDMITTKWHPIAHKCPFIENLLKICNLELMCCNCVAIGHPNVAILKGVGLVWLNTKDYNTTNLSIRIPPFP
jgi:hypothetical protein